MAKFKWEVYLRANNLTKDDDRDCIAEVHSSAGTRKNENIADRIVAERTEFRKETIVNILDLRDKAVKRFIQEGLSVMDGLVQISPRVSGAWANENAPYDPEIHKRTVDLEPTLDFRNALDEIGVIVLGTKDSGAHISLVTDAATGLTDGTITIGDDIIIDGEKIKVNEKDFEQGVFFKAGNGTEYKTTRRLTVNRPSQLIARVPSEVPAGAVEVIVRTKYTGGGTELKEIRETVYKYPCTAKKG